MSTPVWRKSSRSGSGGSGGQDCIEAAKLPDGEFGLRDSKDPNGPKLTLTAEGFASMLRGVKQL